MNASEPTDDELDALLRAAAPGALTDDGFVARTMAAVDLAARHLPTRRAAPVAPAAIARALVAQQRLHAQQARTWRWAGAGVVAGFLLMVVAVALSPGGVYIDIPSPTQWYPLATLLAIGAIWVAWRELRT